MPNTKKEMFDFIAQHISKSDLYEAQAIASISAFIIKKRAELKMSQKDFAEMMGVTQGMVSRWESANYNFSIDTLSQICEKLGATFTIEFMPENEYINAARAQHSTAEKVKSSNLANWNLANTAA